MEIRNLVVQLKTPTIDRLTNMPCVIIDNILGRLPIKDAVRTCILSRPWRHNWLKLSTLVFDDSCGGTSAPVVIRAPKLKYLYLYGDFGGVILQNCPLLVDITLIDYPTPYVCDDRQGQEMSWTLLKDLCLLSNLRSLKISAKILKNLRWTNVSGTLLTPSNQLKSLEINSVCLKSTGEVMAFLSLLKMFSNTPELYITRELELINFILACSPFIEKMTIECDDRVMGYDIMFIRKLLQLKRSWERVTISFSYIRF